MGNFGIRLTIAALAFALAACSSTVVRESGAARPAATPRVSTPKYGATAAVQRGDTLYGIAFRNGIDVRDLAAWNSIEPPYTIYPGQSLRLSPRTTSRTPAPVRAPAATPARTPATPAATASTTPPRVTPAASSTAPATTPVVPAKPVDSGITWRWPADGTLLNRYIAGQPTKQGIDITGNSGAPVRAAADGTVVYSGSGLVGYGELIIIKHNDAWLSAYGHNKARLVNEGAIVKAGQQIAEMGRSGAARDMLHFEVRHNGKPVDPLVYLPSR